MFNFEKLEVWQEAIKFADLVYDVTRAFPAEGSSRSSRPDFARFVEIATGSLFEVISQANISQRQGFLAKADFDRLYSVCEKQSKMLSGLRKSLLGHAS